MADRIPSMRSDRVISALLACGLVSKRQTGSHLILTKPGLRRPVPIPRHDRELTPAFIADLLRQAEVDRDEFLRHV